MPRALSQTLSFLAITLSFAACSADEQGVVTPIDADMLGWWTGIPSGERVVGELVITRQDEAYTLDFTARMTPDRAVTVWILSSEELGSVPVYLSGAVTDANGDIDLQRAGFSDFVPAKIAVHDHYVPIPDILELQISTETIGCEDERWPERDLNPCKYIEHLNVLLPE